jgi:hypothetical protein
LLAQPPRARPVNWRRVTHAIEVAYATPIRPKLLALSDEQQAEFQKVLTKLLHELSDDGITMGRMVSNVLSCEKQADGRYFVLFIIPT